MREAALGPDHPDTLESRNNLAIAYCSAGRTARGDRAASRRRSSCARPSWAPTTPTRSRAAITWPTPTGPPARSPEATALHEATLKLTEAKLGPDHPDTLGSRNNLAYAYRAAGRLTEAIALYEETLELREAKLGPDHPDTLMSRNNLAIAYRSAGRLAEAIALHEETLKLREGKLGPTTPTRSAAATTWPSPTWRPAGRPRRSRCTRGRSSCGRPSWARPPRYARTAATTWPPPTRRRPVLRGDRAARGDAQAVEAKLGPDHPDTLTSRNNLAVAYQDAGRPSEAIALHEATLKLQRGQAGPRPPRHAQDPQQPGRRLRVARPVGRGRGPVSRHAGPPP